MQSVGFEQTFMKFNNSSDVWCLDLYLMNTLQNLQSQRDAQTLHSS